MNENQHRPFHHLSFFFFVPNFFKASRIKADSESAHPQKVQNALSYFIDCISLIAILTTDLYHKIFIQKE